MFKRAFITTKDKTNVFYQSYKGNDDIVVIMLHGLFGTSDTFFEFSREFQRYNISHYSMDFRGFGRSEDTNVGLDSYASDLNELIENNNLGDKKIYLLGYSMGTIVSSIFKQKYGTNKNIQLIHISPLLFIRKRKLLFNIPFGVGLQLDIRLAIKKPLSFAKLFFEILTRRGETIIKNSLVFIGKYDFCFHDILPRSKNILLVEDNHYLPNNYQKIINYLLLKFSEK